MSLDLEISVVRKLKKCENDFPPIFTSAYWVGLTLEQPGFCYQYFSLLFLMTLKHNSADYYIQNAIKTDRSLNSATKEWENCHAHGPNEYCWQAVQVPTSKMWKFIIRGFDLLENSQMLGYFVDSQLVFWWNCGGGAWPEFGFSWRLWQLNVGLFHEPLTLLKPEGLGNLTASLKNQMFWVIIIIFIALSLFLIFF